MMDIITAIIETLTEGSKRTPLDDIKRTLREIADSSSFRENVEFAASKWIEACASNGVTRDEAKELDPEMLRLIARSGLTVGSLELAAAAYAILDLQSQTE